jgi:hypothetical protein
MGLAWERKEKRTGFWWESPKERDLLEDQDADGKMGSEWILQGDGLGGVWSESSWLRMRVGGGLL